MHHAKYVFLHAKGLKWLSDDNEPACRGGREGVVYFLEMWEQEKQRMAAGYVSSDGFLNY